MRDDKLGQLIREDDEAAGNTWVFNYDNRGIITSRVKYAYTTAANPGTALPLGLREGLAISGLGHDLMMIYRE